MTDWGAHMIDIANWGMGIKAPGSAMAIGGKFGYPHDAMETPDTMQVLWQYPDFSMIWEHAVGVGRGPEQREHGVEFHGNDGVLVVDRGGWEVYPETDGVKKSPHEYRSMGLPRRGTGNAGLSSPARRQFSAVHEIPAGAALRRRDRSQLHDRLPPGQHRISPGAKSELGSRSGAT